MRLLLIDNFDSFTYNLVQYLRELGAVVRVVRNDTTIPVHSLLEEADGLVVSPGPCAPAQAGVSVQALRLVGAADGPRRPALGVCLGHQALAEAYGGRVVRGRAPMHGKTSPVWHDGSALFAGLPCPTEVMRYHSLIVEPESLPPLLRVSARTPDGTIMGLAHREHPIFGVQFHPESIMTADGKSLLARFLDIVRDHEETINTETQRHGGDQERRAPAISSDADRPRPARSSFRTQGKGVPEATSAAGMDALLNVTPLSSLSVSPCLRVDRSPSSGTALGLGR